ncbi:hypothetical protein SGLAM104S_10600 [Streptomyces glaucescens]
MSVSRAREYAGEVVPMCTTVRPATRAANSGAPRARTASTAASSASISSTTRVRANTSAASVATSAPAARSGWARSGVRFQTTSGVPADASRRAMGPPITPRPMNPTCTAGRLSRHALTMTAVIVAAAMTAVIECVGVRRGDRG